MSICIKAENLQVYDSSLWLNTNGKRLFLSLPCETRNSYIAAILGDKLYIFSSFYHNTVNDFYYEAKLWSLL